MTKCNYGARSLSEPEIVDLIRLYREQCQVEELVATFQVSRQTIDRILNQRMQGRRYCLRASCSHCGSGLWIQRNGHHRMYCGQPCRDAAYYQRKRQKETPHA